MEYELFRSKLKPSVDGALVSDIIRSSSSGLNSHRTAAMGLIIGGSIQERRKRMFEKAKNSLRSDPTPQAKRTSVAPNISIPETQPLVPAPAPQPPSQSLPNDATRIVTSPASASAKHSASPDSPAPSKRAKGIKVTRGEEPPEDVRTNQSSSQGFVELGCRNCGLVQLRTHLRSALYCKQCPSFSFAGAKMKCFGCGTIRVSNIDTCTGCHRTFK